MGRLAELLSQSAKIVLNKAQDFADKRQEKLASKHLVKALLTIDRTVPYDLIRGFGLTKINLDTATTSGGILIDEIPALIEQSAQLARAYHFSYIEPEHFLFVCLTDTAQSGYQLLNSAGLPIVKAKEKLLEWFMGVSLLKSTPTPQEMELGQGMGPGMGMPEPAATIQTSVLASVTTDLTALAAAGKLDPIVQRDEEIEALIRTLLRRKKNNPLIIGDPGVGKTALVHGLAHRIARGQVPARLAEKTLLELSVPSLVAGTIYRGQFEERVRKLISELKQKGQTIIFIDEIHTLSGTGSTEGTLDLANILKPVLVSGEVTVIGATTHEEYNRYFAPDRALERRFQPLNLAEPTMAQAKKMLVSFVPHLEKHHQVQIDQSAIESAITLTTRYLPDRLLPDKAIDILDEACTANQLIKPAPNKLHQVRAELNSLDLKKEHLTEEGRLTEAVALRIREQALQQKILAAKTTLTASTRPRITHLEVENVISRLTGIPQNYIATADQEGLNLARLATTLNHQIVGQKEAKETIMESLTRAQFGLHDHTRPFASYIFIGPTGVGKTETARVLAREVFGSAESLIKLDMSEFSERHTMSQLIGSPKGYIGHDEGGTLVDRVRRQPYSVVLLDEIEKAHPDVFNVLLQILEDGTLTDTHGRQAYFRHTIIILTSNLGSDFWYNLKTPGFLSDTESNAVKVDQEIADFFRPELLARFSSIIHFSSFNQTEIRQLVRRRLKQTTAQLKERRLNIKVEPSLINWLVANYQPERGARSIDDLVKNLVEKSLLQKLIKTPKVPALKMKYERDKVVAISQPL